MLPTKKVEIDYTNHRGERRPRIVMPHRFDFTSTRWHPEQQWVMVATDLSLMQIRYFAMRDIHSWRTIYVEEPALQG